MTVTAIPAQKTISPRTAALVIAAIALVLGGWAYSARYAQCDFHSKFCAVSIAGTRSEAGFTWDSWDFYVSTYPAGEPGGPVGIPV